MKTSKQIPKKHKSAGELVTPASHVTRIAVAPNARHLVSTDHVAAATVRVGLKGEGQGVLVPGNFVLTAAHCVEWTSTGDMTLAESEYLATVSRRNVQPFRLQVVAVEPVSDIAVLGAPDNQEFSDDCDRFEAWLSATAPVPVATPLLTHRESIGVSVFTHAGEWVSGTATHYGLGPSNGRIWVDFATQILAGASGGPVVADDGRLVGLMSHCNIVSDGPCNGMMPLAHLALPQWVWRCITQASDTTEVKP